MKKEVSNLNIEKLNNVPKTSRELIIEKYKRAEERSKEIQEELKRVAEFKKEITERYNIR